MSLTSLRRRAHCAAAALLAVPLLACSLQNFDSLTSERRSADSSIAGSADAAADAGVSSDAQSDAASDRSLDEGDALAAVDADGMTPDVAATDEAGEAGDGGPPSLLTNGSFEDGYTGWLFSPPSAMGKYAFTQYPVTGAYTIDGQYELATWSQTDAFTVKVYQLLTNVPDGAYTFSGYFNLGTNNAAYLYSKNCGGPDQMVNIEITAPTSWEQVSIADIEVTGGACEVGFFVDASPTDWLNADAFAFVMVPQPTPAGDGGLE